MNHPRRRFLKVGAGLAAGSLLPLASRAALGEARSLDFFHTHTHEKLSITYAIREAYLPDALSELNRFLRDHYSGSIGTIDPQLFDFLWQVQRALGTTRPFDVISGYRCAETNEALRARGGGGVAKKSLHMEGRAIDVRLSGVPLADLRRAAIALQGGGVGYYPGQFVHLDTGRVRQW